MQPIVNCEEFIGKTVGRRVPSAKPGEYGLSLQATLNQLSKRRLPKGVFRFHTHEEADQWLMDHTIPKLAN